MHDQKCSALNPIESHFPTHWCCAICRERDLHGPFTDHHIQRFQCGILDGQLHRSFPSTWRASDRSPRLNSKQSHLSRLGERFSTVLRLDLWNLVPDLPIEQPSCLSSFQPSPLSMGKGDPRLQTPIS